MITESILGKRLDYRGVGREKGRSIHSYVGSLVEGILLFSNTVFKVSTRIQIQSISVLLHPCETSVRENNSSWEESCTSLCGRFHSGTLGENNVREVATAIVTVVERVSTMWFIFVLFTVQDSELCGSDG